MAKEKAEQLTTGKVRFNFPHLLTPYLYRDAKEPVFDVQVMVPKSDKKTITMLKNKVKEQEKLGFPKKRPAKFIYPLKDGKIYAEENDLDEDTFKNYVIFKAKTKADWPPLVVGPDRQELMDAKKVYSGCAGRIVVTCSWYDNTSKGVGFYINMVQILPGGENIAPRANAEDFFDEEEDFGDDDSLDTSELDDFDSDSDDDDDLGF